MAGCSAAPHTTGSPGYTSPIASAVSVSCTGLRNDQRYDTAMTSTCSSSTSRCTAPTTSAGSSGTTTWPSRSIRSWTAATLERGTTWGGSASQPSSSITRVPCANRNIPSNPLVVSSPTRRPVLAARVLVTAVVPRPKRLMVGSRASSVRPLRSATSRAAASTPSPSRPGVVGALARHVVVPSVSTASVNVPPTSMPRQVFIRPHGRRAERLRSAPRHGRRGALMEDRITPVLYLEMTDMDVEAYAADRVPKVLDADGVTRATWWTNCVPFRTDLPRTIPEFHTLGVYEADGSFSPLGTPDGITGLHMVHYPRPGQGTTSERPTLGLELVLISPRTPEEAQALRDWGDFVHLRDIAAADCEHFSMITPYENATK